MTAHSKQNVDQQEVAKFDSLASNWWDPNGEMKPLHQLNPLRLAYVQKYVDINHKKILDVGCGGGIFSEALSKAGAEVSGIDMSAAAIKVAKEHAEKNQLSIHYQVIPIEEFAINHQGEFDVVTCMELLEHVPDPTAIIAACASLVKPTGSIFFSTINRNIKSFFSAIIGAEYLLNLLPKGTHHYQKFIRPSELTHWAKQAGLTFVDLQGIHYQPLDGTFSYSSNVDVNYLAYFKK